MGNEYKVGYQDGYEKGLTEGMSNGIRHVINEACEAAAVSKEIFVSFAQQWNPEWRSEDIKVAEMNRLGQELLNVARTSYVLVVTFRKELQTEEFNDYLFMLATCKELLKTWNLEERFG